MTDSPTGTQDATLTFANASLPEPLVRATVELGFEQCTAIQALTLPEIAAGNDIAAQAQTGTGKTAAFLLGAFALLMQRAAGERSKDQPRMLVIAPTRELAIQIKKDADDLGKYAGLTSALAYGGIDYDKQRKAIEDGVDVLIGTPGRLIDYFKQKVFNLKKLEIVVLDEADRMFDLGFIADIRFLLRRMPEPGERTSMLFSATLSHRVMELAYEHMDSPRALTVAAESVTADGVNQTLFQPASDEKIPLLLGLMKQMQPERSIVFVNTKRVAEQVEEFLLGNGIECGTLSGDVRQNKRQKITEQFASGSLPVLIATDVAARGLHIDDVSHVFNYDLPQQAEDYVHRIGRTARAGTRGEAVSFACEKYSFSLPEIQEFIGQRIPLGEITDALLIKPKPRKRIERDRVERPGDKRGAPARGSKRTGTARTGGGRTTGARPGRARSGEPAPTHAIPAETQSTGDPAPKPEPATRRRKSPGPDTSPAPSSPTHSPIPGSTTSITTTMTTASTPDPATSAEAEAAPPDVSAPAPTRKPSRTIKSESSTAPPDTTADDAAPPDAAEEPRKRRRRKPRPKNPASPGEATPATDSPPVPAEATVSGEAKAATGPSRAAAEPADTSAATGPISTGTGTGAAKKRRRRRRRPDGQPGNSASTPDATTTRHQGGSHSQGAAQGANQQRARTPNRERKPGRGRGRDATPGNTHGQAHGQAHGNLSGNSLGNSQGAQRRPGRGNAQGGQPGNSAPRRNRRSAQGADQSLGNRAPRAGGKPKRAPRRKLPLDENGDVNGNVAAPDPEDLPDIGNR